jgi:hypothetical protein
MPTVLRIGSYRFHFYSDEGKEPPHIHIEYGASECKFWLDPISLARNKGIKTPKLREIEKLVFENKQFLMDKYYEFHRR